MHSHPPRLTSEWLSLIGFQSQKLLKIICPFLKLRKCTGKMITDDMALLREYARRKSEKAFAALLSRHVNLVYSVALRQVCDPDTAFKALMNLLMFSKRRAAHAIDRNPVGIGSCSNDIPPIFNSVPYSSRSLNKKSPTRVRIVST
jgi:hypothetical protein